MPDPFASNSPDGQGARDVLVGLCAANDAASLQRVLHLVKSLRWFGGDVSSCRARVVIAGEIDPALRLELESLGAELSVNAGVGAAGRLEARRRVLEDAAATEAEMILILGCDRVVVADPLPFLRRGVVQLVPDRSLLPVETLDPIFRHFGLTPPLARSGAEEPAGGDEVRDLSGTFAIPSEVARRLVPIRAELVRRLREETARFPLDDDQIEEAALLLGLSSCGAEPEPLAAELDFDLDIRAVSAREGGFALDPAILRTAGNVDGKGDLFPSPIPFAQVRIEAFNRTLRGEREGKPAPPSRKAPPPGAPGAAPARVVVLGMHRSGTSALTHLLSRCGLFAGESDDLPPGDEYNRSGYWEHRGVWSIDEALLLSLGSSWSDPLDLDLPRLEPAVARKFEARIGALVRDLDRRGPWVIKDPRLCLLLPYWRKAVDQPICVLIHRGPLAVARSLAARDGLPIPIGIALWEAYNRAALASTEGMRRVLVSHRELVADPVSVLRRLRRELRTLAPELGALPVPSESEILQILDPTLVHHADEPERERLRLNPPQAALLDALLGGAALADIPVAPLSDGGRELLSAWRNQRAESRGIEDRLTERGVAVAWLEKMRRVERLGHEHALLEERRGHQEGLLEARREHEKSLLSERGKHQEALLTARRVHEESLHEEQRRSEEALLSERQQHERALDTAVEDTSGMARKLEELRLDRDRKARTAAETALRVDRERDDLAIALARAEASAADRLNRALSFVDELDALLSAMFQSRSWKLGRVLTAPRRLLRKKVTGAAQQRDRLIAEARALRAGTEKERARPQLRFFWKALRTRRFARRDDLYFSFRGLFAEEEAGCRIS